MKNLRTLSLLLLTMASTSTVAFADDGTGVACAGGIVVLVIWLVVLAVTVGVVIFIIKWIKKDATARGMANADSIKWLGLLGLLGLLIYVLQRPK